MKRYQRDISSVNAEHTTYRRFMVVILVITVGPQPIFLIIIWMTWHSLIGMDGLDVSSDSILLAVRAVRGVLAAGRHDSLLNCSK